jgi:hypothetical protein
VTGWRHAIGACVGCRALGRMFYEECLRFSGTLCNRDVDVRICSGRGRRIQCIFVRRYPRRVCRCERKFRFPGRGGRHSRLPQRSCWPRSRSDRLQQLACTGTTDARRIESSGPAVVACRTRHPQAIAAIQLQGARQASLAFLGRPSRGKCRLARTLETASGDPSDAREGLFCFFCPQAISKMSCSRPLGLDGRKPIGP